MCLHRPEHTEFAVPSMRIFEIVAAGAVAICGEHPFIRQWFGDTVLYVNPAQNGQDLAAEIDDHLGWICSHPRQAREMVSAAQAIFNQHLCLEKLLADLVPEHQNLLVKKYFLPAHAATSPTTSPAPLATIILNQGAELDLTTQTDPRIQIIKSSTLSIAIAQTITPYTAIFAGTWQLFPNHFAIQINYLEEHPEADIICSDANSIQGHEGLPLLQTYLIRTHTLQNLTAALPPELITPEQILQAIAQNLSLQFTYDLTAQLHGSVDRPIALRPPLLLPERLPNSRLRNLYLRLSGGGASNSNPNAIARMLIALRDLLSNHNIT
ncbi:MAG: glycosyltransferase family 1 protein [Oscillatoriales cyanobacterium SM2_2_1]|nr:glycosyltransferase family 1 protein [Oscillatoriales cyanobacterium SM2_2_1]